MMFALFTALGADFSGTAQPNTGATIALVGAAKQATLSFEQYGPSGQILRLSATAPLDEASGRAALLTEDWGSQTLTPGVSGFVEFGGTQRMVDASCLALKVGRKDCAAIEAELDLLQNRWNTKATSYETARNAHQQASNTLADLQEERGRVQLALAKAMGGPNFPWVVLQFEDIELRKKIRSAEKELDAALETLERLERYAPVAFDGVGPGARILLQLRIDEKKLLYTVSTLAPEDIKATCKALELTTCSVADIEKLARTRRYQTAVPTGIEFTGRLGGNYAGYKGRPDANAKEKTYKDFGVYTELKARTNLRQNQVAEISLRGSYGADHDEQELQRCTTTPTDEPEVAFESCKPAILVDGEALDTYATKFGGRWSLLLDGRIPGVLGEKPSPIGKKDALRFGVEVSSYVTVNHKDSRVEGVDSQTESWLEARFLPFLAPAKDATKVNMGVGLDLKYALTDQAVFDDDDADFARGDLLGVPFVYIGGVLDPRMK